MKPPPILFLLCLMKGITSIPLPATTMTAQQYTYNAQQYVNSVPGAKGMKVATVSPATGKIVLTNPPSLPTVKTTTTTKAPVATTTTTKAPTTTTTTNEAPTTTTTNAPTTLTTDAPKTITSTTLQITGEIPTTTCKPNNEATEISDEGTTKASEDATGKDNATDEDKESNTENDGNMDLPETSEQNDTTTNKDKINLVIAQLIILINEPITDATCQEINQLILQLNNELINKDAANYGNLENENTNGDNDRETTIENGNSSNTSTNNSNGGEVTKSDQIKDLVKEIVNLINEPGSTTLIREKINELRSVLTEGNGRTSSDEGIVVEGKTDTDNVTETSYSDTNGGTTDASDIGPKEESVDDETETKDGSSDNSNVIIATVNQLLQQLIGLNGTMDTSTNELICQLINVLTNNDGSSSDTNSAHTISSSTVNAKIIENEQMLELISEIKNQLNKSIENVDTNSLDQVMIELIKQLTSDQIHDTNRTGENSNLGGSKDEDSATTTIPDNASTGHTTPIEATDDSNLAEIHQLLSLISKPIESMDVSTNELLRQLKNVLTDNATNGDDNSATVAAAIIETINENKQIQEMIAELISRLRNEPIENANNDFLNESIKELIKQLSTGKVEDTNDTGANNKSANNDADSTIGITSTTTTTTSTTTSTTTTTTSTTTPIPEDPEISHLAKQLLNLINQPTKSAEIKKIKELAGQLIKLLDGSASSASMKQLMSDIKKQIRKPNTTRNNERIKQLVGELIGQLPGDHSPSANTTEPPSESNGKPETKPDRRASRRTRWAEYHNKEVSTNSASAGVSDKQSVESTFPTLSRLLSGLISSINLSTLFSAFTIKTI